MSAHKLEAGVPGSMSYNCYEDAITYHLKIQEMDSDIFPLLRGTEEIWIITKGRMES
jgi:hypothetical protein